MATTVYYTRVPEPGNQKWLVNLPIRTVNSLNKREHWTARMRRARKERLVASASLPAGLPIPADVKLTRVGPRMLDDDNLVASFKAIRDGIADRIGVNDGSDQIKFSYAQRKGKPKEYAVEIQICGRAGAGE